MRAQRAQRTGRSAVFMTTVTAGLVLLALSLAACGQTNSPRGPNDFKVRRLPPEQFDLLESAFHKSAVTLALGERVEMVVEVQQQKDDYRICGVPIVRDPFGNALQTLALRQNTERETETEYVYESGLAFFPAIDGEYAVEFENRECLLGIVPATATVRWTVFASAGG